MYCTTCGKEGTEGALFCGTCGAQMSQAPVSFERVNVWFSVFLTIITLGFYLPYWFLSRYEAVNKMNSTTKLNKWPFHIVVLLYILPFFASLASTELAIAVGTENPTVRDLAILSSLMQLIGSIILIAQAFKLRRIFSDHFAAKGEKFSGIWTFLGNIWYFQYKVNKLFY